jgi:hypothetical protein
LDSFILQGAALLQRPELMHMFNRGREAIDQYLKKGQTDIKQSFSLIFDIGRNAEFCSIPEGPKR